MAHRILGGWVIPRKLFVQVKVSNELWYYGRSDERQYHLVFIGWYDKGLRARIIAIDILWVSIHVGIAI